MLSKVSTLTLTIFVLSIGIGHAQFDASNLFGGLTVGYAKPVGDFSDHAKGGLAWDIDLGYRLTEQLAVGVHYGAAVTAAISEGSGVLGLENYALQSWLARGWYLLGTNKVKPFVGLGLGFSNVAEPDVTISGVTTEGAKRSGLGAMGELGLALGDFILSYSYHMCGKSPEDPVINGAPADLAVNYHRFAVGYLYNF